ncbi:hypothetical protein DFR24_4455 [Panacagrimonas perspica]|uniref:Uncharacterized protein n=1 Tax=Panacagrimonas perspica TaxID=381431 RepID=A0A4R7NU69_9GAMM|nr:hypothetical protein [Panacagrimonas perspica]TDU24191.1 hypothetical protein DFR24_4455 [Panacagrimonas perspica]THD04602.1 hypothetical protein B1810_04070 [Panacagrimonas perspica]
MNAPHEELTVRPIGFKLPCRQFLISTLVTRDRRLPLVDEFVLRILRLNERLPAEKLRAFLGFSEFELGVVLSDLQSRGLVNVTADVVELHPAAMEMFRISGVGPPQIMEVEEWVNRIWFDLISNKMIPPSNVRNIRNLIELRPVDTGLTMTSDFARNALQTNFREYLKSVRKINNPDHLSLYAITSVEAYQFSYVQLLGRQVLKLSGSPTLEVVTDLTDSEKPARLTHLTDAVTRALATNADAEPTLASKTEYARMTGTSSIHKSESGGYVNISKWRDMERVENGSPAKAFVGVSYLEDNRKMFVQLLTQAIESRQAPDDGKAELIWFRPGGGLWGTSEELRHFISDVRNALRGRWTGVTLETTLVMTRDRDQRKRFGTMFDRGILVPLSGRHGALEVLLVRGFCALVSVLVPVSATAGVWLGRITTVITDLERIEERSECSSLRDQALQWPVELAGAGKADGAGSDGRAS